MLPARVRLTTSQGLTVGTLIALDEKTMTVLALNHSDADVVPRDAIAKVELSGGVRRQGKKGALIGLSLGSALALFVSYKSGGLYEGEYGALALGVLILGGVGAGVGFAIGSSSKSDRWEDIPVSSLTATSPPMKADSDTADASPDRQVRFAIGPTIDRGVQARFSISWR